jgi:tetratricopeptide (TPR) repeat protein
MQRRYANSAGYEAGCKPAPAPGAGHLGALAALQLLLSACSSTPPLPPMEQYPQRSSTQPATESSTSPTTSSPAPTVSSEQPAASNSKPSRFARQPKPEPDSTLADPVVLDNSAVPPAAQQQFADAVALATSGDLAAAEKAFDSLNAQYPSYAGPLINLAVLRAKAGNLEGAEQALQAAVERNPDSAPAFNQLGVLYRRLGRFKDADVAYQKAVQLDPAYASAYFNLGVLCDLYLQEPQRALEAFERYLARASEPDPKVRGWIIELKTRLGSGRSARSEQ